MAGAAAGALTVHLNSTGVPAAPSVFLASSVTVVVSTVVGVPSIFHSLALISTGCGSTAGGAVAARAVWFVPVMIGAAGLPETVLWSAGFAIVGAASGSLTVHLKVLVGPAAASPFLASRTTVATSALLGMPSIFHSFALTS